MVISNYFDIRILKYQIILIFTLVQPNFKANSTIYACPMFWAVTLTYIYHSCHVGSQTHTLYPGRQWLKQRLLSVAHLAPWRSRRHRGSPRQSTGGEARRAMQRDETLPAQRGVAGAVVVLSSLARSGETGRLKDNLLSWIPQFSSGRIPVLETLSEARHSLSASLLSSQRIVAFQIRS